MTINGFRLGAPDIAYIGAGVTVKGAIVVPDVIVVDGVVEGDVTAKSIRIGPSGAIKGNVISTDVDVSGTLAEKADIKEFLLVRASGRVEGHVNCGGVRHSLSLHRRGGGEARERQRSEGGSGRDGPCAFKRAQAEDRRGRVGSLRQTPLTGKAHVRAAAMAVAFGRATARRARARSARHQ
jgi:hypothetical protein